MFPGPDPVHVKFDKTTYAMLPPREGEIADATAHRREEEREVEEEEEEDEEEEDEEGYEEEGEFKAMARRSQTLRTRTKMRMSAGAEN